jgi:hypothetical protein
MTIGVKFELKDINIIKEETLGIIVRCKHCLTPLSIIFQLNRGGQFYWWKKPEYTVKTTDLANFIT